MCILFLLIKIWYRSQTGSPFGAGLQCPPLSRHTSVVVGRTDWVSVSPIVGLSGNDYIMLKVNDVYHVSAVYSDFNCEHSWTSSVSRC